ncbi:MAG: shikimate kinase [Acidimicrobiia bacterium]
MILWLVGMMGSGKTTVGRLVADATGTEFRDTDAEVETRAGMTIADLWAEGGEELFRSIEADVIVEAARRDSGVVATGGGAVTNPATRALISSSGMVIWLRAQPGELVDRLTGLEGRPLLDASDDLEATLRDLAIRRSGSYRSLADHTLDVDGRTPEGIAAEIEGLWKS